MQNQREVFKDEELLAEGLGYIKSQYDFVETFPLIGHAMKVTRHEGVFVNPWIISV